MRTVLKWIALLLFTTASALGGLYIYRTVQQPFAYDVVGPTIVVGKDKETIKIESPITLQAASAVYFYFEPVDASYPVIEGKKSEPPLGWLEETYWLTDTVEMEPGVWRLVSVLDPVAMRFESENPSTVYFLLSEANSIANTTVAVFVTLTIFFVGQHYIRKFYTVAEKRKGKPKN